MSVRSVAVRDFRSASRSRGLWAVATLFSLVFALVAYVITSTGGSSKAVVQNLFSVLTTVLALLLPIVALVASYMAIAGERESGGIKFLLGFPNSRRDVFVGKLASRLTIFAAGLVFLFGAAGIVATVQQRVLAAPVILGTFLVSLVYGSVFVGIAIALSGAVAARSKAIAAAVGSYFGLIILFIIPGISITAIVRWLHTSVLGYDANLNLYNAISYLSPYTAYRKATNLALPEQFQTTVFRRPAPPGAQPGTEPAPPDLPVYLTDEFSLVVFAAWLVIPLVLGYLRFQGADLE